MRQDEDTQNSEYEVRKILSTFAVLMVSIIHYLYRIFFVILCSFPALLAAQYENQIFESYESIQPQDTHRLILQVTSTQFLKNNEYFSRWVGGYTGIGFFLRPTLTYQPSTQFKLRLGVQGLKYAGLDPFSQVIPILSFQYAFTPGYEVIMGHLQGTLNHRLKEPLFEFDRYYKQNAEYGIQLLGRKPRWNSDTWINWEQFIFQDDPFQEEFIIGHTSEFHLLKKADFELRLPIQLLYLHQGGQINSNNDPLVSIANTAGGLLLYFKSDHPYVKNWGAEFLVLGYKDLSHQKQQVYDGGYGFYPSVHVNTKWVNLTMGYWNGFQFIAPRGEYLFQSVSQANPAFHRRRSEVLTTKMFFDRKILPFLHLSVRFETYYGIVRRTWDYSYGFHLRFDQQFLLKKSIRAYRKEKSPDRF